MRPALRYRLWTSGGPVVAVVLAVMHGLVVADSHAAWRGDPLWAVQQLGSSIALGLPVFLTLCALPPTLSGGARTDTDLSLRPTARLRAYRVAVDAGPSVTVHVAFVLGVLVYTGAHGAAFEWRPLGLSVAVQVLSLVVVCALGRALGEVGMHVVAAAVAALVGVLLAGFASNVFRVTAGDSSYAGLTLVEDGYVVATLVLGIALLVLVFRHRMRIVSGVLVAVTVFGIVVTADLLAEPEVVPSGARPTACHDVDDVEVCVFPGYEFMRDSVANDAMPVLAAFDRNQVDPHLNRIEQSTPGHVEEAGSVALPFDRASLENGSLGPSALPAVVLHPTWCPRVNSPEPLPRQFDRDQRTAYYWLGHAMGRIDAKEYAHAVPAFAARSAEQQRAFVQGFLDRNASCEGLT